MSLDTSKSIRQVTYNGVEIPLSGGGKINKSTDFSMYVEDQEIVINFPKDPQMWTPFCGEFMADLMYDGYWCPVQCYFRRFEHIDGTWYTDAFIYLYDSGTGYLCDSNVGPGHLYISLRDIPGRFDDGYVENIESQILYYE